MFEIKDNFLSEVDFKLIENTILKNNFFPWFKQDHKVYEDDKEVQFTHYFYNKFGFCSDFFKCLNPILDKINPSALVRIKANLSYKENTIRPYLMHTDQSKDLKNLKTGIFYLNTNNGKTLFDDQEVQSVRNRMIIFPNYLLHTGTTHTDTNFRCVINFNWY